MAYKFKTVDLFAGIGGIRRGFELTGKAVNVLAAENDKYACKAYEHIYKENPYYDVKTKEFKELMQTIDYDILLAGFPCQAFSLAGKKLGFEDKTRGTLFFDIAKIIELTRPKGIFLENVKGLLNHKKGMTFQVIAETLDNLGYKLIGIEKIKTKTGIEYKALTKDIVRTPIDFGIPQNRPRVYLIGFRKADLNNNIDLGALPTHNNFCLYKDLNDLIDKDVAAKYYLSERYWQSLKRHKQRHKKLGNGFGYVVVNDKKPFIANTIMATGGSGKERNLIRMYRKDYDGIKTKRKGPFNSEGIRNMTPREWGKLQGFVNYAFVEDGIDKFSLPKSISDTQRYKLFGNSVYIPVIETLASYMLNKMEEIYNIK